MSSIGFICRDEKLCIDFAERMIGQSLWAFDPAGYCSCKNEGPYFNHQRKRYIFNETADTTPTEIVKHLFMAGEKWRNGRNQNDDITFIVFKYHPNTKKKMCS